MDRSESTDPRPIDDAPMTDMSQMHTMLLENMSNFVNDETRPIMDTVQNMSPDAILPMLANIVQIMPQEQVRQYLTQSLHMQGNELEEIMDQVSHLYVFLNQDKGQGQPGSSE